MIVSINIDNLADAVEMTARHIVNRAQFLRRLFKEPVTAVEDARISPGSHSFPDEEIVGFSNVRLVDRLEDDVAGAAFDERHVVAVELEELGAALFELLGIVVLADAAKLEHFLDDRHRRKGQREHAALIDQRAGVMRAVDAGRHADRSDSKRANPRGGHDVRFAVAGCRNERGAADIEEAVNILKRNTNQFLHFELLSTL